MGFVLMSSHVDKMTSLGDFPYDEAIIVQWRRRFLELATWPYWISKIHNGNVEKEIKK